MKKNTKERLEGRIRYLNFSEDVDIIKETNIDENLSLYIVKNRNGVTFQNVPVQFESRTEVFLG